MAPATAVSTVIAKKKYEGTAGRILKLLCSGVTQSQAAKAVGVEESYVSQLCKEIDFQEQIQDALNKSAADAIETDKNYNSIEKMVTDKLKTITPMVTNVDQLMRLGKFVNDAKRKIQQAPLNAEVGDKRAPVQLILSPTIIEKVVINQNNEIVGVGERTLVTLNSKSINSLVENYKRERAEIDITPSEDAEIIKVRNHETVQRKNTEDPWANL